MQSAVRRWLSWAILLLLHNLYCHAGSPADPTQTMLDNLAASDGVIVHVGCGDGMLTMNLRVSNASLVFGLDTDPSQVAIARRRAQSSGLLGTVTIAAFDGQRLPLIDNLANVIVVSEGSNRLDDREIERVLRPSGIAKFLGPGGRTIRSFRKPNDMDTDEWTHFLHDPSGNPVAHDRAVGPPRRLQWADGPLWSRSHEYDSSLCGMVSANGRLFSIFDEGPTGIVAPNIPDRWTLTARDAYNGVVLWKRPIEHWGWKAWRPEMADIDWWRMASYRCASPLTLPRRLVAVGNRVYVTLGYDSPLSALDAATGKTVATYTGTEHADEILFHQGRLVLCVRQPAATAGAQAKRGGKSSNATAIVMAIHAETGRTLWQTDRQPVTGLSLAVTDDKVVFHSNGSVHCLDLASGNLRWTATTGAPGVPLVAQDGVVASAGRNQLFGLSTQDGSELWKLPGPRGFGVANPSDLFVIDGLLWYGQAGADGNSVTGYDLKTGKAARTVDYGPLTTRGHHARCYRSKATDNYLLLPKRAVEFVDLHGTEHSRNNWVRGACRYGVLPCNGLLYATPHPCFCYAGVKLGGFLALAPDTASDATMQEQGARLEQGPAFAQVAEFKPSDANHSGTDWPAYRHDSLRSGSVDTSLRTPLKKLWDIDLGGKLTQPVVARRRVLVADRDAGVLNCLDAATGKLAWSYVAGGRIDSSPTCYRDTVIFGSADGYVYCLRATDGRLSWRFRAAPIDRRLVSFGQIESVWPVHGSVLILKDVAYFAVGRSSYLDGGLWLYGLDPTTGAARYTTRLHSPQPDSSKLDEAAYAMEGAKSDILVSDGSLIYLYHNAFDLQLNKVPTAVLGEPGVRNLGERTFNQHLFSNAGFLDDSWFSRNHWMLGDTWTAFNFAHQAPKEGQLLVFDDYRAYAVKCFARRNRLSPLFFPGTDGYFLYADEKTTDPVIVNPRQQPDFLRWLPQEGELQKCWNLDIGFARSTPPEWLTNVPVRIRAMVLTNGLLFAAGPPDMVDDEDPLAAIEGRRGAVLVTVASENGEILDEMALNSPPVFDGLSAANGRLYLSTTDGRVQCLGVR